jgi:phenylpyruvate tautomerase PptA (4-oxalocrotonate tautomerase family)
MATGLLTMVTGLVIVMPSPNKKESAMPVIHVYTAEGFLSPARKRLMIEKVTAAAVEAEGLPTTDRTYVLVHEVPDFGWGWQGNVIDRSQFEAVLPPDPEAVVARDERGSSTARRDAPIRT